MILVVERDFIAACFAFLYEKMPDKVWNQRK